MTLQRSLVLLPILGSLLGCIEAARHGPKPLFGYPVLPDKELLPYVEELLLADTQRLVLANPTMDQLERADHYLTKYLASHPGDSQATTYQGLLAKLQHRYELAVELLGPQDDGTRPYLSYALAEALIFLGKHQEAQEKLNQALTHDPHNGLFHLYLAIALEKQGFLEDAREHYLIATEFEPGLPLARQRLDALSKKQGLSTP